MGEGKSGKKTGKFAALPFRLRYRIACLLHDGATPGATLKNPQVRKELDALGADFTPLEIAAVKRSAEYRAFAERRERTATAYAEIRLSAALLQDCEATGAIAEQLKIDLLHLVRESISASPDDPSAIERLVRAAVALSRSVREGQNARLRDRVAALTEENFRLRKQLDAAEGRASATEWNGEEVANRLSSLLGVRESDGKEKAARARR